MTVLSLGSGANQLNLDRKGEKKISKQKKRKHSWFNRACDFTLGSLFFFLLFRAPFSQTEAGLVLIQLTANIDGCRKGNRPSVNERLLV